MEYKNGSQLYESENNKEDNISIRGNSNNKHKKINYISQSNTLIKINKLEKSEESLLKEKKSHKVPLSQYYNKELSKIYANFLKSKRNKISNQFDDKNAKKFLDKKDKCMQRIVLSEEIEEEKKDDFNEKQTAPKSSRKSGVQKNIKNYCIVISDYDNSSKIEAKYNYTVKIQPRKIDKLKKNNNLSKYFLNNNESNCKFSQ